MTYSKQEMVERMLIEFNKDKNYDDEIPDEMKKVLCHLIENKDWDGLTNFMRIGTDLTRRECASRASDLIIQAQREAVEDVCETLKEVIRFNNNCGDNVDRWKMVNEFEAMVEEALSRASKYLESK